MLKIKNRAALAPLLCALVLVAGCAPPGPRALLEGKRLLDHGKPQAAVECLQSATRVLRTNALAWSYLGLAYHQSGQLSNAVVAYQRAQALDRNLVEVSYNLGCALLDLNRADAARSELMAYTMQRKTVDGLLKLGAAQLRLRETGPAEQSFSSALKLSTNHPAAWNGLGLAHLQRNRARDAAQCFVTALRAQPDYAPALRNLAVVLHQHLNNRPAALEKYRDYAALKPRPADADAALALARQLEQELAVPPRPALTNLVAQPAAATNLTKPPMSNAVAVAVPRPPRTEVVTNAPPKPAVTAHPPPAAPPAKTNVEVVKLPDSPVIKVAQDASTAAAPSKPSPPATAVAKPAPAIQPPPPKPEKPGFFARLNPVRLFSREPKPQPKPTPLPVKGAAQGTDASAPAPAPSAAKKPDAAPSAAPPASPLAPPTVPPPAAEPPKVPRYVYRSPAKPAAGNHAEAERAFAQGLQSQRAQRWIEAIQSYLQAARVDPAYFDAYYNLGLAAHELRSFQQALAAFETALAINPASADARYNFAVTLRDAGYVLDAASELDKLLAASPGDTRAHLALGNLCAQRLRDPQRAKAHYLKVLEVEPHHPQAASIRYWLANNPG